MKTIKDFFFLNFSQYENIGMNFPIGVFLILLCIVGIVSVFFLTYYRMFTRSLYSQLLRHNAKDEQSAKTLSQLRLDKSFAIRSSLSRSNGQLTYIVKRAGQEELSYDEYMKKSKTKGYKPEKIDFSSARFYIPAERMDTAKKLLENFDVSWIKAAVISLVLVGLLVLSVFTMDDILSFFNGLVKK